MRIELDLNRSQQQMLAARGTVMACIDLSKFNYSLLTIGITENEEVFDTLTFGRCTTHLVTVCR